MINIIIGGDTCPNGEIELAFKKGDSNVILNDVDPIVKVADYFIVNLECPLIKENSPIDKDGPVLGASVECTNGIKAIGINAVNLANNHILDHGAKGLKSTIDACEEHGVDHFGAGDNLINARKPLIKTIGGKRFCFMGVAEHEFSVALDNSWGANPANPIDVVRSINKYKKDFDHLIILVHGGKEYYRYPNPKLQDFCRFLVEEGADTVICQHSHCAGTYEYYMDKPIVYGQGNFIFENLGRHSEMWSEGFLVSLNFIDNKVKAEFIPYEQSNGFLGVKLLKGKKKLDFLDELKKRSDLIKSTEFVKEQWIELCKKDKYLYASRVLGHNRLLRVLNRKLHFSDWLYKKETKMMVRNVVECEVHREGLETLWRTKNIEF